MFLRPSRGLTGLDPAPATKSWANNPFAAEVGESEFRINCSSFAMESERAIRQFQRMRTGPEFCRLAEVLCFTGEAEFIARPVAFAVQGKEYIGIAAGNRVYTLGFPRSDSINLVFDPIRF